jgi:nucleoside 2-deoxyribosyltransferase
MDNQFGKLAAEVTYGSIGRCAHRFRTTSDIYREMTSPTHSPRVKKPNFAPAVSGGAVTTRRTEDMKIYLAGPLFTTAEYMFNKKLAELLRDFGHEVFLPQETEQRNATCGKIYESDVAGIDWSEVVVANMDGVDPDSGTCWECGYAHGKKPVILFRTDIREEGAPFGPFNLMMHQAAGGWLDCKRRPVAEIASLIDERLGDLVASK